MTREPSELVGTIAAGKYRVVGVLGRGSMGTVYEAEGLEGGTPVALKVLRVDDATIAARFLREAKTMSMFQHRNIVELLEVGSLDDGTLYFATELVRGTTLREQLAAGPLETRRALAIARQVVDALGHAHAMGVVHRDIKPENIMLAGELVKILDFGVAKLIGDTPAVLGEGTLTITGFGALGTPAYMSPEAVLGRVLDARADLYAVGVLLFELLVGKPPYAHDDIAVLMRMHAAAPIPSLRVVATDRVVSPELELVITEALAKKPELRFKSAAEMIDAIDAAVRSLDVQAAADAEAEAARARAVAVAEPSSTVFVADDAPAPVAAKRTDLFGALPQRAPAPPADAPAAPLPSPASVVAPAAAEPLFTPPMPAATARGPSALEQFGRKHRRALLAGCGIFAFIIVVAFAVSRRGDGTTGVRPAAAEHGALAREASELLAAGHPARALERLEREDFGDAPDVFLVLGHARVASGRRVDGLAAYERAIARDRRLAGDAQLRANLERILATKDAVAGVIALELATRLDPPAHELIQAQANAGKLADVRRRARAIAERERLAIDRVESWSLDLAHATTCEDRLAAVLQLRRIGDARALPALRRARAQKCVEREATEAIAHLEAATP